MVIFSVLSFLFSLYYQRANISSSWHLVRTNPPPAGSTIAHWLNTGPGSNTHSLLGEFQLFSYSLEWARHSSTHFIIWWDLSFLFAQKWENLYLVLNFSYISPGQWQEEEDLNFFNFPIQLLSSFKLQFTATFSVTLKSISDQVRKNLYFNSVVLCNSLWTAFLVLDWC